MVNKVIFLLYFGISCSAFGNEHDCQNISSLIRQIENYKGELKLKKLNDLKIILENCKLTNDTTYHFVLFQLSYAYYIDNSIELHGKLSRIVENHLKNSTNLSNNSLIKCYWIIGRNYGLNKDNLQKIEIYKNILEQFKNDQNLSKTICQIYEELSNVYIQQGDYEKAYLIASQGEEFSLKTKNTKWQILNILLKAKTKNSLNLSNDALVELNKAIEISKKLKDKTISSTIFRTKGYLLRNLGRGQEAIDSFLEVKKLYPTEKFPLMDLDIGFVYYDVLKDFNNALKFYLIGLANTEGDDYLKMRFLDNIGAIYWVKKDFLNAFKYYQQGFTDFKKLNFNNDEFSVNPSPHLIKSFGLKDFFLTLTQDKAICWLDYAKSENNKKEYLQYALQTYELADKLIDYMRHEHTGTQSKFFWRNKTRPIYESAIETCFLLKDYQKAFYFFEKSRSVLLNDKLNELGAKQKLSEADLQREKKFLKQISELNSSIENVKNAKLKADLNNKLLDLQEQQDRFIKSLETKNPAYYQLKYDTQIVDLKTVQAYLKGIGGGTLVEYFVGDSATYSIVVSPTNVAIKKLKYDLSDSQKLLTFCSKNLSTKAELTEFNSLSYKIYQSLIEPLHLPKGRLIISQDGAFLPFEALSKAANRAEYMVNDYMISYTYSAQFLLKNQEKKGFLPNKQFIGFAPVNFAQKLNPLIGSDESLDKISKNYFWNTTLTAHEGNKKAFLENAPKFQIVQIYTHAFADSNESEPRIYFADSTLKVSELGLQDRFKTNLLVLAACRTGVGKVAKGEGVLSLARGFSMLGIPATVTSLWSVEDKDTYKLTELFYSYLNEGLSKDEALQKAKIEMLKENPSPNVWAGLVLIGDSSKIESDKLYLWISGLLLITLVLLFSRSLRKTK